MRCARSTTEGRTGVAGGELDSVPVVELGVAFEEDARLAKGLEACVRVGGTILEKCVK